MYNRFFTEVYRELQSRNLVGATGSIESDESLAHQASAVVWDIYCSNDLPKSDMPVLDRIEQSDEDIANYFLYIFEGDVYVKVEAHAGRIYLDTSGPIYP